MMVGLFGVVVVGFLLGFSWYRVKWIYQFTEDRQDISHFAACFLIGSTTVLSFTFYALPPYRGRERGMYMQVLYLPGAENKIRVSLLKTINYIAMWGFPAE
ncbi:unnamed protein product [Onchocerca flexuosa]|uniref:Transmembrane 9 superfamily member n=1 Tax=Onchocerca flexuosa TaxID=387005 RepID=A0A183HMX7_9BILA|nr:unnamed protein product [Onchocerca flexuosa]